MIASIARRYARALLDVASETSSADALGAQLAQLADTFAGSPELRDLLANPAFSREQRQSTFTAVAQSLSLAPALTNLVHLLIDRNRADELGSISRIYDELADEAQGRAHAQVWTATELPAELSQQLQQALSKAVKREVRVETQVDPSLLGGAVAQVGSYLFDGSIKGRLRELRRELKQA